MTRDKSEDSNKLSIEENRSQVLMADRLRLDPKTIASFKPSKAFSKSPTKAPITSVDFDDTGEWLVTAAQDEAIQLYDCKQGTHSKTLFSKKYGVHLARFTHRSSNIVYASTKENDVVRYLSLHDNSFIRYFRGHEKRVVSLELSPNDDTIISAAHDNTVRLWDLKSPTCQGLLHVPAPSLATFDPTGQIFTVTSHDTGAIMLYDLRNYDKEPFSTWTLADDAFLSKFSYPPRMPQWTKIEFSNDGKHLLIATEGEAHYILDAFSGEMKFRLNGHAPTNNKLVTSGEVCFTPDGRHVIAGSGDRSLVFWDLQQSAPSNKNLPPSEIIQAGSLDMPHCVAFNPRNAMMVTADSELVCIIQEVI